MNDTPYAHSAPIYWRAGWRGILPLPPRAKTAPPLKYTGRDALEPSWPDIQSWIETRPQSNVALHLPADVVGLDVDAYGTKNGGGTLEKLEAQLGRLPATWVSTSRGDGVSGIRLYRVSGDNVTCRMPGDLGTNSGIEVIRHDHRYAVVWPSMHPEGMAYDWTEPGGVYNWSGINGAEVPSIDELPRLPDAWESHLVSLGTDINRYRSPVSERASDDEFGAAARVWTDQQARDYVSARLANFRSMRTPEDHGYNDRLNALAVVYGHFVPEFISATRAEEILYEAAEFNLSVTYQGAARVRATIRSGLAAGARERYSRSEDRLSAPERAAEPADEPSAVDGLWSEFLDSDGMDELPDPEPVIDGWLYRNSAGAIIGKSGDGKSFLVLDMAGAVGSGQSWHGANTEKCDVWWIVAEGATGVRKRKRAWELHHGRRLEGVRILPRPIQANGPEWGTLVALAKRERPGLVFIDTQARVTVGMAENDNTEMGMFVEQVERLRKASGACVKVVHHIGKNGDGGRGASALYAAWSTEITVSKSRDGNGQCSLLVENTKNKDEIEQDPLILAMEVIDLGEDSAGRPLTSCVLTSDPFASVVTVKAPWNEVPLPESAGRMAEIMRDVLNEGRGGTRADAGAVYREKWGGNKSTTLRAWNRLVEIGALVRVAGTQSYRYVPPDEREEGPK